MLFFPAIFAENYRKYGRKDSNRVQDKRTHETEEDYKQGTRRQDGCYCTSYKADAHS